MMEPAASPQVLNEVKRDLRNALMDDLTAADPEDSTLVQRHILARRTDGTDNAFQEQEESSLIGQRDVVYPSDETSNGRYHLRDCCSNSATNSDDGNLQGTSIPDRQQEAIRIPAAGGPANHFCFSGSHNTISSSSPENDDLSTTESLNSMSNNKSVKSECIDRPRKRQVQHQEATRLSDIIGHEDAKLHIWELTLPLALPEPVLKSVFTGIRRLPTTILLHGPPGCGKTKLARAIAGEAAAALIQVSPSDVLSKFVGESEAIVRNIFYSAVEQGLEHDSRCAVIFIDEIDALGQNRDNSGVGEGEACARRILTELLIKLNVVLDRRLCTLQDFGEPSDETPSNDRKVRIVVAAATNRPDDCDRALLRRFEVSLEVGLPTPQDRLLMFEKHLSDIDHSLSPRELNLLAAMTADWSGSGIETLCRNAVQAPVRECIRHAINLGTRVADYPMSRDEDHSKTAYHALLAGITALRPVTLFDFQKSIHLATGQEMPELDEELSDEQTSSPKRPRLDL